MNLHAIKDAFGKVAVALFGVAVISALVVALVLAIGEKKQVDQYHGVVKDYQAQVTSLRAALTVSCDSRITQHNASHEATAALITYYRSQLQLANDYYTTSLKIIRSYPPATQHLAIVRLNANRQDLSNVLEKQEAAYVTEATFECAH